ncbi:MAG: hypothetical protein JZD41_07130 [Thermoproteus sp.]|nr:hypothetical protein [Thermoproteus sp.]
MDVEVEESGGFLRIKAKVGEREYISVGLKSDYPTVVGLLVVQLLREGIDGDYVCEALRRTLAILSSSTYGSPARPPR